MFDKMQFLIKGKKINLRKILIKDVNQEYVKWLNDFETNKFMETRHSNHNIGKIIQYIKECKLNNSILLAICLKKKKNLHIGNIKIGQINNFHKTAEISYFIGNKNEWGKGYGSEAVQLAVEYAFKTLNLYKCLAGVYGSNVGSYNLLKKTGFKKEAKIKNFFQYNSGREDHIIFSITNKNFNVQK